MSKPNKAADRKARAAALRAERERKERQKRLLTIGGVVLAVLLLVGGVFLYLGTRDTTGDKPQAVPAGVVDDFGVVVGDPSAPRTITIYEDFQCPICAAFEAEVGDELNAAVEAGKVKVDYRMVSFLDDMSGNDYSSRAMNAAAAVLDTSGIEVFKAFHDELFANQPAEQTDGPDDDALIAEAVEAGAEEDAVRGPIEDKVFEQWITNATDQMSVDGVNGTPTVFIDGKLAGDTIQKSVDALRAALK